MFKITNYIDGKQTSPTREEYLDNINPATSEVYSLVPKSSKEDTEVAIEAAKQAFPSWSSLSPLERSKYLRIIADKIEEKIDDFSLAETKDNGKPIKLSSSVDIPRAVENFRYFAQEILNPLTENFEGSEKGNNTTYYSPLGVVACISPWNLPLYLFSWKVAPALAAGCTVVAKPSEVTPMTAYLLGKICEDILPPGVFNIVHGLGHEVGETLSSHPEIKALSFTGSTETGQKISIAAAPTMKRLHLEMGGKNPNIIFADCDFEKAVETTVRSSFANQGQICLCGSRIYVERPIYEKFKSSFIKKISELKQGDPQDGSVDQGAVVSRAQFDKVLNAIETAKSEGGRILTGGKRFGETGYFIEPTLIESLSDESKTNQEEIFGPVATIHPFDSELEVVASANCTKYGLAGTIWSTDLEKANRVAREIKSGIMWINCWLVRDLRTPFGGMKESGRGREGGRYILKFFSDVQNICIKS